MASLLPHLFLLVLCCGLRTAAQTLALSSGTHTLTGSVRYEWIELSGTAVLTANTNFSLAVGCIVVKGSGAFILGSDTAPFTSQADIVVDNIFTSGPQECSQWKAPGIIVLEQGSLMLYGSKTNQRIWTTLRTRALPGTTTLDLNDSLPAQAGDEVVVASSDFEPSFSERVRVASGAGTTTLQLDAPLKHMHWGSPRGDALDIERAEVGLLTHNIRIRAGDARVGAHIIAALSFREVKLHSVALVGLGRRLLGTYPVHFHLVSGNTAGRGEVVSSSIYDSILRCISIHGTNFIRYEGNVAYNNKGHCVFLEIGTETDNIIHKNLVLNTQPLPMDGFEYNMVYGLWSDRDYDLERDTIRTVTSFWLSHPRNSIIGNVAAATVGHCYWLSTQTEDGKRGNFQAFRDNACHSSARAFHNEGRMFQARDGAPEPPASTGFATREDIGAVTPSSGALIIERMSLWKLYDRGFWCRNGPIEFHGGWFSDCGAGVEVLPGGIYPSFASLMYNMVFIGRSPNTGNLADTAVQLVRGGRAGSRRRESLRAFNLYDGPIQCHGCTISGYDDAPNHCVMKPRDAYSVWQHSHNGFFNTTIHSRYTNPTDLYAQLVCRIFDGDPVNPDLRNTRVRVAPDTWLVPERPDYLASPDCSRLAGVGNKGTGWMVCANQIGWVHMATNLNTNVPIRICDITGQESHCFTIVSAIPGMHHTALLSNRVYRLDNIGTDALEHAQPMTPEREREMFQV